jgi:hypothetical protein
VRPSVAEWNAGRQRVRKVRCAEPPSAALRAVMPYAGPRAVMPYAARVPRAGPPSEVVARPFEVPTRAVPRAALRVRGALRARGAPLARACRRRRDAAAAVQLRLLVSLDPVPLSAPGFCFSWS